MAEASAANLELAIALPLGVVANQLMKIQADLRLLNMKALGYARERHNGSPGGQIGARLEQINEALDVIRGLMSDIEADLQPKSGAAAASSRDSRPGKSPPERED